MNSLNDIDNDIYKKYGKINIKDNLQISKLNINLESNNINFLQYNKQTPYCSTTYDIFKPNASNVVPYNESLNFDEYCNKMN